MPKASPMVGKQCAPIMPSIFTDVGKRKRKHWRIGSLTISASQSPRFLYPSIFAPSRQLSLYLQSTKRTATVIDELHEFNFLDFDTIKDLSFDDIRDCR